jgi:hypothetical protein
MIKLLPNHFAARKTGKRFAVFSEYLIFILMSAVIVPGVALIYVSMHGRDAWGLVALAAWILVLWWLLVQFHEMGFIRMWLSVSLIVVIYATFAFTFAHG